MSKHQLNLEQLLKIIQPKGLLSQKMKGFESRPSQQKMLADIIDVYNQEGIALIEAGTGTGKSIAYLLPAMIWAKVANETTLISTNTIALQEQLIYKDIPLLSKALDIDVKAVLVKGMNNYLCLRKLHELREEIHAVSPQELEELDKIEAWGHTTNEGSRSDLNFIPTFASWEKVSAEREACNQRECPYYKDCFFFKARRQANDARILIANHSILFADLVFSDQEQNPKQNSGLLPKYTRVILDEAHHIEDVATDFFSMKSSRLSLMHILSRMVGEKQGKINTLKQKIIQYYKGNFSQEISAIYSRLNIEIPGLRRNIYQELDTMFLAYQNFLRLFNMREAERTIPDAKLRLLPHHLNHLDWTRDIIPSTNSLIDSLKKLNASLQQVLRDLALIKEEKLDETIKGVGLDLSGMINRLNEVIHVLTQFITKPESSEVRWIESQFVRNTENTHLINAQLNIASALNKYLFSQFPTIVLCSATLTTNKEFTFFRNRLGLTEQYNEKRIIENIYESPFDFKKQAFFGVPTDLPEPHLPEFMKEAVEQIWNAIEASHGNAFILFTSYQMLQECYQLLVERLKNNRYVPMKQGDTNRKALIDKFKSTNRSILFGTDSFWEGVDVAGDALRCVIIVKLPFKVPTEPMIQARAECIVKNGGNSFTDYLLPHAIVKFKQGAGRLIRKKTDRGCIICLDARLLNKNYGKFFLNSLPNCQQVFVKGGELKEKMEDFYRQTYHFVK